MHYECMSNTLPTVSSNYSWLLEGEQVLWEGAPPRGLHFYPQDRWLVPFSLAWTAFCLLWEYSAWTATSGWNAWVMSLWGMPFFLWGLFLVFGRFLLDCWVRRQQRYFVTDKRVLVVRRGWRGRVIAASIDFLPFVNVIERANGAGDIRFGPTRYRRSGKTGQMVERDLAVPALNPTPQFLDIPDVAGVRALIERAALG